MDMVKIPNKNYYIGRTTVTQGQWKKIMGTEPWKGQKYVQEGDGYPAVYVNWDDAVAFCKKLSDMEGKTYRLPTEAEWEYACLAGETTEYHFGDDHDDLSVHAWFDKNAGFIGEEYAHQVGKMQPNQFGLYDMHGNVFEWCSDWYNEDQEERVVRGGAWCSYPNECCAQYREYGMPEYRGSDVGFRLASTST